MENSVQEDFAAPLLISVRSVAEAQRVADQRFELLDLKEPTAGPLAACDPRVWLACVRTVAFEGRWSVALGELNAEAIKLAPQVPAEIDFVKAGPAGITELGTLCEGWRELGEGLQEGLGENLATGRGPYIVAVAYADHASADCLSPERVLEAAIEAGLNQLLVDTFCKSGPGTLETLGMARLQRLIAQADRAGIECVIAGKVDWDQIPLLLSIGARRIGVRGGVCDGPRDGEISQQKVRSWVEQLRPHVGYGNRIDFKK